MSSPSVVVIGEIQQLDVLAAVLASVAPLTDVAPELSTHNSPIEALLAAERLRREGRLAAVIVGHLDGGSARTVEEAMGELRTMGVIVISDDDPDGPAKALVQALASEATPQDVAPPPETDVATPERSNDAIEVVDVAQFERTTDRDTPHTGQSTDGWDDGIDAQHRERQATEIDWDEGTPAPYAQRASQSIDWDDGTQPPPAQPAWTEQSPPLTSAGTAQATPNLPAVRTPPPTRFDASEVYETNRHVQAANGPKVVFVASGKGGVGKSTVALTLAWRAAAAGVPTCLVDANRGQGDLRILLRLNQEAPVRNIALAARGDVQAAMNSPEELSNARHTRLPDPGFSFVAAPPPDLADPRIAGPDVYRSVVDAALAAGYFVVVDTQIAEAYDTTGLWDEFIIPTLNDHSRSALVAVLDGSAPGIQNTGGLVERLLAFERPPRTFVLANRVTAATDDAARRKVANWFAEIGVDNIAFCEVDREIERSTQLGGAAPSGTELASAVDEILYRLTELRAFESPANQSRWSIRGLFRR